MGEAASSQLASDGMMRANGLHSTLKAALRTFAGRRSKSSRR